MTKRNNTITYLKGLAMMLVVLGHAECSWTLLILITSFLRMPLFFMMSGYCFKERYLQNFREYMMKRIKGLYKPFVKWNLIFIAFHNLFVYLHIYDPIFGDRYFGMKDFLHYAQLTVFQMRGVEPLLGGYWFLNALFIGSILSWLVLRYIKRVEIALLITILITLIVHVFNIEIIFLNFNTRACVATLFIIGGHALARKQIKIMNFYLIAFSFILTYIGTKYWSEYVGNIQYEGWRIFPYIVNSCVFTWAVYSLFDRWKETKSFISRFMLFVGENTLTMLTWHLLAFKLVSIFIICYYHLPIQRLGEFPVIMEYASRGWWAAYFLAGVSVSLLIAYSRDWIRTRRKLA